MPKIILIKHALPNINPQQPAKTWALSDEGRKATIAFANTLRQHNPQVVIASQEPKASETGRILADTLQLPFETAPNLHEHDRSHEPFDQDPAQFHAKVKRFFDNPDTLVFGSEMAYDTLTRFHSALRQLPHKYPQDNVAVVAHGTVISLFVAHVIPDIDGFTLWQQLKMPDAVILQTNDYINFALDKGCEPS